MKEKIKVLHVVGAMNRGGTETMLMNLFRNMDRNTFHFDFVSYSKQRAHYDEEIGRFNGRIIRLTKRYSVKELYDCIKKYGPYDVVHAHTLFHAGIAVFAALLASVNVRIVHAHTTNDTLQSPLKRLYAILMRMAIRLCATHFLACSEQAGAFLFGKKVLKRNTYSFFPNAIDYQTFLSVHQEATAAFKRRMGIKQTELVIGHIGTFKKEKNQIFLLSVLESILEKGIDCVLLFVGEGEEKAYVEQEAERRKLQHRVKFLGIQKDIPVMLHSMDVFLLPSLYEGFGLVLLEAQASGIPCLVSEHIQPEADLRLGLVKKLSLTKPIECWRDEVIRLARNEKPEKNKIKTHFLQNGFTVETSIKLLEKLYRERKGERDEKSSASFL